MWNFAVEPYPTRIYIYIAELCKNDQLKIDPRMQECERVKFGVKINQAK